MGKLMCKKTCLDHHIKQYVFPVVAVCTTKSQQAVQLFQGEPQLAICWYGTGDEFQWQVKPLLYLRYHPWVWKPHPCGTLSTASLYSWQMSCSHWGHGLGPPKVQGRASAVWPHSRPHGWYNCHNIVRTSGPDGLSLIPVGWCVLTLHLCVHSQSFLECSEF